MINRALAHFGAHLRELRQQRGLSQERLAELAGLHRTYLGGIERGERNVSLINLGAIANALDLSLSALFEGLSDGQPCHDGDETAQTDD